MAGIRGQEPTSRPCATAAIPASLDRSKQHEPVDHPHHRPYRPRSPRHRRLHPLILSPIRQCSNGRTETQCTICWNLYWLTPHELDTWTTCPHCARWINCWPMETLPLHVQAKITVRPDGCWEWIGARKVPNGYGYLDQRRHGLGLTLAHRLVWQLLKGNTPEELHHACHFKPCVNPDHLVPTTRRTHGAEHHTQDTCKRGHLLTGDNVYTRPDTGARMCRACQRDRNREATARRHEQCATAGHPPRPSGSKCRCGWRRY